MKGRLAGDHAQLRHASKRIVSSGSMLVGGTSAAGRGRRLDMRGMKRAKRDRWIMGVCGGIAHRYGWSSTAVRIATIIVAIIIPGVSVVPTLLLGYLLPETDEF